MGDFNWPWERTRATKSDMIMMRALHKLGRKKGIDSKFKKTVAPVSTRRDLERLDVQLGSGLGKTIQALDCSLFFSFPLLPLVNRLILRRTRSDSSIRLSFHKIWTGRELSYYFSFFSARNPEHDKGTALDRKQWERRIRLSRHGNMVN